MEDHDKITLPEHFDSPAKRVLVIQLLKEYPVKNIAAAKAGIHPATLHKWMNEDEAFRQLVDKAVEIGKSVMFDNILKAGKSPQTWQASAWVLERIDPATFGRVDRSQVQVSGPGGGPVVTAVAPNLGGDGLESRIREVVRVLHQAGRLPEGITPELLDTGMVAEGEVVTGDQEED